MGTEPSEGRGTTGPFLLIGAPGVEPPRVAARLAKRLEAAGVHRVAETVSRLRRAPEAETDTVSRQRK
jgi:uncharacterized protein YbbC (DUF1343 family)